MKRLLVLLLSILAMSIPAGGAVGQTAPTITFTDKPPATVVAPDAGGIALSYTVDSLNDGGQHPAVSCDYPAGTRIDNPPGEVPFTAPLGTTTVTCSLVEDSAVSNSFTVTVTLAPATDTTPPTLADHGDVTIASGTSPAYTPPAATDDVDPNPTVSCNPGPLSSFAAGTTMVTCTASDASGNTSAPKSFTVTVTSPPPSNTPPAFTSTPPNLTREATGPGGATVSYALPTATDAQDGPVVPHCAPASGGTFGLGTTTVVCTATDSQGASATPVSFTITVVDTTAPILTAPADITVAAASSAGTPASSATIAAFLGAAVASDQVDASVAITTDAPATFPVGTTAVTFTARDDAGNGATAVAHVTVLAPGSPAPAPPPRVDRTPPADVTKLSASAGNALVRLSWTPPAKDFDHVAVLRALSEAPGAATQVYKGKAPSTVDRGLRNGVEYRYTVIAYDAAGNRSSGVVAVATPHAPMLLSPKDGAKVKLKRPPKLVWRVISDARYYNVQLFRVTRSLTSGSVALADVKVLSAWPRKAKLPLRKKWKYAGHRYRLAKGTYRWYVWPGIGARAAANYGPLLGAQTFVVR